MRFRFIDEVLEVTAERAVAVKRVVRDEPALQDHFPTFQILPGVLMLETLAQAARLVIAENESGGSRYVIGWVKALKYGAMAKPGTELRVTVELKGRGEDGSYEFKGSGLAVTAGCAIEEAPTAVSGRFSLRSVRVSAPLVTG